VRSSTGWCSIPFLCAAEVPAEERLKPCGGWDTPDGVTLMDLIGVAHHAGVRLAGAVLPLHGASLAARALGLARIGGRLSRRLHVLSETHEPSLRQNRRKRFESPVDVRLVIEEVD
jgi:hypothetical protein